MEQYCKGTREDAEDIVDFANYVFSKVRQPHDFKQLIPKLYADGRESEKYHYLVKENGKIKGMVCVQPVELAAAGRRITVGSVGTVAVHPYARGKGYMKRLMNMAVSDMKAQGFTYSVLGGQRQRYEYFGYEPAGVELNFLLTATNLRHKLGGQNQYDIAIVKLRREDTELLDAAYALYSQNPLNGARSRDDFWIIGQTWDAALYAILVDGCFEGYFAAGNGALYEVEMENVLLLPAACGAFFTAYQMQKVNIYLPAYEREKIAVLADICEGFQIGCNHAYHIFNFQETIQAYMAIKASYTNLQDGRFVLEIEGEETVEILVESNRVAAKKSSEKADLALTRLQATAFLFSPISGYMDFGKRAAAYPENWFPIPLYVPSLDCC